MNFELNELNLNEIGSWSASTKGFAIALVCFIVIFAVFWTDTRAQLQSLAKEKTNELELRKDFESKQQQAANLNGYRSQLHSIEQSLGRLINQLPAKTEVPELLENISKTGIAAGLTFRLFKPQTESQREFISELPIKISVIGSYHQLGKFVSQIVALPRIVTLHDFIIEKAEQSQTASTKNNETAHFFLKMDITAKTYRYKT